MLHSLWTYEVLAWTKNKQQKPPLLRDTWILKEQLLKLCWSVVLKFSTLSLKFLYLSASLIAKVSATMLDGMLEVMHRPIQPSSPKNQVDDRVMKPAVEVEVEVIAALMYQ